jgi:hypothetical protein
MGFLSKTIVLSLLIGSVAFAADPDCKYSFRFTNRTGESTDGAVVYAISGATPTVAINNKTNACTAWSFQYDSEGLSALSIALQSAPATGLANTPGTFATFAGTTVTGSNPSTATDSSTYTATGYYPFLRINLASSTGTGSINITLNGWKSPAYISSGGGGGSTPRLDQVLNPTTTKTFTMGSNFLTFTFGATTSTTNLFTVQDSVSNTGTGYVATIGTASGSAANPLRVLCGGVQCISTSGSTGLTTFGNTSDFVTLGAYTGVGFGSIYFKQASPSGTNFSFLGNDSDTYFNAPATHMFFRIANVDKMHLETGGFGLFSNTFTVDSNGNTVTSGLQLTGTSTDPSCTLSGDVGKQWIDTTSATNTHMKVCALTASVVGWKTVF